MPTTPTKREIKRKESDIFLGIALGLPRYVNSLDAFGTPRLDLIELLQGSYAPFNLLTPLK